MLSDLLYRIRSIFRRGSMESELNDEIRFHMEQETEKLIGRGVPPLEAERQARLAFGFNDLVKEQCRDERGTGWVESLGRDLAFSVRLLRMNASFTAVALLSLGMGIGANTAIFQLLDAVRLRSLPVSAPDELYEVVTGERPSGNFNARYSRLSYGQWEQIEARQQAYSSIGAWSGRRFNLASGGETRPAEGLLVSGRFFETLGVQAAHGRLLGPGDDRSGCGAPAAAVISDSFWRRELGGAADAVGRAVTVDGHTVTVVGITPASFFGVEVGRSYDLAVPLCAETQLNGANSQLTAHRDTYWLSAIGRIRAGWTARQADAHLRTISKSVFAASLPAGMSPERTALYQKMWLRSLPAGKGVSWLRVNYEKALWLLFYSAALVLLVACVNLANLLLARASARTHEMAVRLALGASRGRLVRQLVTESLLLALMGAGLGLLLAGAVSRSLVAFLVTASDPVALHLGIDWRVLSFSMAMGLYTCLLFGLAPAVWASRVQANSALAGGRRSSASRGRSVFRSFLVGAQVALSLVLVSGAMLFGRSLFKLLGADTGFRSEQVLVTSLDARRLGFDEKRQRVLFDDLLVRLRATPGVIQAAQSSIIPLSGWEFNVTFIRDSGQGINTLFSPVSTGYFATVGTTILAGRDFTSEDNQTSQPVVIVNEEFARKFFPGENALGRTVTEAVGALRICRIVGVAKNTKYVSLQEAFKPIAFLPASQVPLVPNYMRYVVRSQVQATELTKAIRETIGAVNPAIDIEFLKLDQEIRDSVVRERLLATLAGGFGLLAGFLSAVGLYGVLSYSVATRRSEIGIRMALGADRARVMRMVFQQAGWLVGAGTAAGVLMTLAAGRMVTSLLYGLEPSDPSALVAAVAVLSLVGLVSSYLPARHASRLDPLMALRQE
jgi:predicted permease